MSVQSLVTSGPLLAAIPVAAAAGAVTFLSPCCLPLVPGYLSYITGMSEAGDRTAGDRTAGTGNPGAAAGRGRAAAGTALFVLGFSFVFATYGYAAGGLGQLLRSHDTVLTQVFGGVTIALGLLFAGAFDRFAFAGRVLRPAARPRAGLAGAPLLGMLFGFGWSPCFGPTLIAVMGMSQAAGTAGRGAFLAFVYGLGLGIPFLIVAVAFQRVVNVLGFFRRNARTISRAGGALLVVIGLIEVTGTWAPVVGWLHTHWFQGYQTPL